MPSAADADQSRQIMSKAEQAVLIRLSHVQANCRPEGDWLARTSKQRHGRLREGEGAAFHFTLSKTPRD